MEGYYMCCDLLELCARKAFDVFQVMNNRDFAYYSNEYEQARNLYTDLLEVCCCFVLIDKGELDEARHIINNIDKMWEIEHPSTFTIWTYLIYNNYKKMTLEINRTDDKRSIYGDVIGKYILRNFLYNKQYDTLKIKMWQGLEDVLYIVETGEYYIEDEYNDDIDDTY